MAEFVRVARTAEIPDPGRQVFEIDQRLVAVFHVSGQVYALDDVCTHDGGPLAEGELEDHEISCPRHGARFDIRDGRALCLPATRPTKVHEAKIVGDEIFVRLLDE
ncbi:MAG: non-heme iron oxygenase ferredoxin subunit [Pirellulales bacterium]|nr:non-heme iron oxygenase ferredoxin subunit [Pirellulales bacterium]